LPQRLELNACGAQHPALDSRDRGSQLTADVEAGLGQLDAGQSRPFDADAVERIKQAGRDKLAALKAAKP
jgi:hypothetical protein